MAPWEAVFAFLSAACAFALLAGGAGIRSTEYFAGAVIYLILCRWSRGNARRRLLVNYAFVLWFYGATSRTTELLHTPSFDPWLRTFDERVFGVTPAVPLQRWARPWLTEALSACYLSYLVYIQVVVFWAVRQPGPTVLRLSQTLFPGFAIGFLGYLALPALGPGAAFPQLFAGPIPGGGWFTRFNALVVGQGAAIYGTFPSLHLQNTFLLLHFDWSHCRRRFWWMAAPAAGLLVSTLYLRYHYAADLLAGLLIFLVIVFATRRHAAS